VGVQLGDTEYQALYPARESGERWDQKRRSQRSRRERRSQSNTWLTMLKENQYWTITRYYAHNENRSFNGLAEVIEIDGCLLLKKQKKTTLQSILVKIQLGNLVLLNRMTIDYCCDAMQDLRSSVFWFACAETQVQTLRSHLSCSYSACLKQPSCNCSGNQVVLLLCFLQ